MENTKAKALMRAPKSVWLSLPFIAQTNVEMDYIAEMIRREIDDYCCKSSENFTIHACVYPHEDASPIENQHGTFVGYETYILDVWSRESRMIEVDLDWHTGLNVHHLGRWMPIRDLIGLIQPQPDRIAELRNPEGNYHHQLSWWKSNGKTFRLLDLPAEIRENIYRHAFDQHAEPYPTDKVRRLGQYSYALKQRNPCPRTFRMNRQVYGEASHVLFLHTCFLVEHNVILKKLLYNSSQLARIRRLQLALSHFDFFKLFGLHLGDEHESNISPSRVSHTLRQMTLIHLELRFEAPSLYCERNWLEGACQKTIVKWIWAAAWPFVRGHPVTVTGYVKTSQKEAFEAQVADERRKIDRWQRQVRALGLGEASVQDYYEWLDEQEGGVLLSGEQRGEIDAKAAAEDWPPVCRCSNECLQESWTADD
ncbi:hypothetical protein KC343_g2126 [Hortaea werneckii]|nr:hypothetical protein KC352_g5878 [Hortaea werneckii]KAI7571295.1 hypothetical protein KC317_g1742 [Hortaea werneckii]KAI7624886.1 hypothetical protein KC346_g2008 [Hortaea werneckii]KAI7634943.1 hypothetical protein KC343_g2126 [Hortaea werneckii]KAI7678587.1 hypothetical protein KC319_g3257 [Hortaea werneckii]